MMESIAISTRKPIAGAEIEVVRNLGAQPGNGLRCTHQVELELRRVETQHSLVETECWNDLASATTALPVGIIPAPWP